MGFQRLSYDQADGCASQLCTQSDNMQNILNEVQVCLNKIGGDDVWGGTAAASSKAEFDELCTKFPQFSEAVDSCAKFVTTQVSGYRDIDARAQQPSPN